MQNNYVLWYKAVYPYMAAYGSIWEDTVAHVGVVK